MLLLSVQLVALLSCEWVFCPDTSKLYAKQIEGYYYHGYLNADGEFIIDNNRSRIHISEDRVFTLKGPSLLKVPNKSNRCYEYRSGRLIPGITTGTKFIPELKGKVIDFTEYHPGKDGRFIYNLPGRFELRLKRASQCN